jgi:hypothetical protein
VITTRIEPLDSVINVIVAEDLGPAAQSKAIAAFAREQLAEAQRANRAALGRVPAHKSFVDGRAGAALETVRPKGGTILFEFDIFADVLHWILAELRNRSPRRSGRYRDSHRLFADGREIGEVAIPAAAEYLITNTVLYARKIEIGKTESGRAFVVQVEPRIYERTAADARRRFGNIARISFGWQSSSGGGEARAPAIIVRTN